MMEVYVCCGKDDERKIYYVEKKEFGQGSKEFEIALSNYNELIKIALKTGYSVEEQLKVKEFKDKENKNNKTLTK